MPRGGVPVSRQPASLFHPSWTRPTRAHAAGGGRDRPEVRAAGSVAVQDRARPLDVPAARRPRERGDDRLVGRRVQPVTAAPRSGCRPSRSPRRMPSGEMPTPASFTSPASSPESSCWARPSVLPGRRTRCVGASAGATHMITTTFDATACSNGEQASADAAGPTSALDLSGLGANACSRQPSGERCVGRHMLLVGADSAFGGSAPVSLVDDWAVLFECPALVVACGR